MNGCPTLTKESLPKKQRKVKNNKQNQSLKENNKNCSHLLILTNHADKRLAQRGISKEAVEATLSYGRRLQQTGASLFFLGKKDIERAQVPEFQKYEGTALIVAQDDGCLITSYRNKNCFARLKKRPKWRRRRRSLRNFPLDAA